MEYTDVKDRNKGLISNGPGHGRPMAFQADFRYPFRSSQFTCGPVYLQVTSPFSSWISHGTTMTTSPSRTHTLFFIFPRMRHILVTLSMHRTTTRLAPSMFVTVPNTSLSFLFGVRTLVTTSLSATFLPPWLLWACLFSLSPSPHVSLMRIRAIALAIDVFLDGVQAFINDCREPHK